MEDTALNTLYISIGSAILLALIVALVGPLFVDWTSYRAAFEREASRVLGQPVRVLGTADMQILPLPHLQFGTVHVGVEQNDPLLVIDQFDVRIELLPLIKGEVEVVDMTLTAPRLRLDLDESGQLGWQRQPDLQAHLVPNHISLNDVIVKNGHLSLSDKRTGRVFQFHDFNGNLAARDLFGPYKIESSFLYDGQPYSLMVSTGSPGPDGVRVKSLLTPANVPLTLALDGLARFDSEDGLHYRAKTTMRSLLDEEALVGTGDGAAALVGVPWSLSADADLSVRRLTLDNLDLEHGPQDQAYRLSGKALVDWGQTPLFDVRLASRQLDLDRALGNGPNAPIDLQQGLAAFGRLLQALPKPKMNGRVAFDVPGVILGGGIVRNFLFEAQLANKGEQGAWQIDTLEADLPGNSRVALSGLYSVRPGQGETSYAFEGEGRLRSDNPSAFAKWWLKHPTRQDKLAPFDLSGQLLVKPQTFALSRMDLEIEGDRVQGRIDWQGGKEAVGDIGSGALSIVARADKLNLDDVQSIGTLLLANNGEDAGKISDISLDISARRFASGGFEGRSLTAKTYLSAGIVDVEQLVIDDFEGAKISVSGRLEDLTTQPKGQLKGNVQAQRLDGLLALVQRLGPKTAYAAWLERSKAALEPLDLAFFVSDQQSGKGIAGEISGSIGGGKLDLKGRLDGVPQDWDQVPLFLSLHLVQPDGQTLVGLLGGQDLATVMPLPALTAKVELDGVLKDGAKFDSRLLADDGGLAFTGLLHQKGEEGISRFEAKGELALQADDLAPYMLAFGLPVVDLAQNLPVELASDFSYENEAARFSQIQGRWDRQPVAGDLVYRRQGTDGLIEGSVSLGDLDGYWLGETLLGPGRLTSDADSWQDLAFLAPSKLALFSDLRLKIAVSARSLDLAGPYRLQQPKFDLSWQPQEMILGNLKALLKGGRVLGHLHLGNRDGQASAKGHIQLSDIALAPLIWERDGRSVATGLLDSVIDFETQGRSLAGLVSALSGSGSFLLKEASLRYLNPEAFDLVVRAVDAGLPLEDDAIARAFEAHMDAGSVAVASLDGTFRLAGGTLRTGSIGDESAGLQSRGNLTMDFNAQTLAGDWSISVEPRQEDAVSGAVPEVGVVFSGPLNAPVRVIDVAPFTGYLSIRAFEREVERIEVMQADILEKEGFRRKLKLYRQEAKRRELEAIAAREAQELQQRQEAERQKRAQEEARKAREAELARQAEERRRAEEKARQAKEEEAAREAAREAERQAELQRLQQEAERKAREEQLVREAEAKRKAEAAQRAEDVLKDLLRQQELERQRIENLRRQQNKPRNEWINPDNIAPDTGIETKPLAPLEQGRSLQNGSDGQAIDPLTTQGIGSFGGDGQLGAGDVLILPNRLGILPKTSVRSQDRLYERGNERDLLNRLRQSQDLIIQLD